MDTDLAEQVNLIIKILRVNYGSSLTELIHIFSSGKYELRLCGETARDIIMNKIPKKLELVSSASVNEMNILLKKRKLPITSSEREVTVTLEFQSFTIGTCWPVHANMSQPKCPATIKAYWMIHAYHRAFTVNSMNVDFSGTIYNYFAASKDIVNGHVRLMSIDPGTLIRNNHLRIFEYFKLFGSLSAPGRHDDKSLKTIMDNSSGLANIKGELVWSEFKKMVMHPKRFECVGAFVGCGLGSLMGLPENPSLIEFEEIARHSNFPKHPLLSISYMCAFLDTQDDVMRLHKRLRLSTYERNLAIFLVKYKSTTRHIDDLIYYSQMCLLPSAINKHICREYVLELLKYHNKKMLFENLLLMPSPSRIVVPSDLQWQKSQLKKIDIEPVNGKHNLSNEHDDDDTDVKEPSFVGKKWSAMKYASLKKKQKLL